MAIPVQVFSFLTPATYIRSISTLAEDNFSDGTSPPNGLSRIDGWTIEGLLGYGGPSIKLYGGLVYGGNGGFVDPTPTPPAPLARYEFVAAFGGGIADGVTAAPDPPLDRVFFLTDNDGYSTPVLLAFDQSRFTFRQMLNFSGNQPGPNLVRWGRDGLAFQAGDQSYAQPGTGQLFMVNGGFVLPAWANNNPIPGLLSVNPAGAQAGGGNFYLTVTGTNFVPGAVLLWNGSDRTTTYVDSQHLKVAISAADIASSGTATLTAVNPGSAASGGISFVIQ